ncbi:hypothetical protein [Kitasatospora sp. NPDC093806]|uniref:hypothetical protein n=1 Tax=Kitasatospora sp. NPDC093806 TaxID=3155075 RepID=UPI00343B8A19
MDDPTSPESALHACPKNQEWIFGGAYVAELARRQYTPDTVLDLPLLRADGSLYVVELKRANIEHLVIRSGGHLMLGAPPHRAVSQAQSMTDTLPDWRLFRVGGTSIRGRTPHGRLLPQSVGEVDPIASHRYQDARRGRRPSRVRSLRSGATRASPRGCGRW